jgi:CheY-like chemotaxis protein
LRFLIVDDDLTNRLILQALVTKTGHESVLATNGREAVAVCEQEMPDMVLMDILMPVMDGYEATRAIKLLAGDRFVPVIFLTALTDEASLTNCIEAGGDDFLTKPYNRALLEAKIRAHLRTRALYASLATHRQYLVHEQESARELFDRIIRRGALDAPNLRYHLSPLAIFNGDLLFSARRPSGGQLVMVGDFAGHGLPAAVGAIPVAEIFHTMTTKGYAIGDIAAEINRQLRLFLPASAFLAAAFIEIDAEGRTVSIWNGGLPDVLIWRPGHGVRRRAASSHLPLRVVSDERIGRDVDIFDLEPGDRILAFTDGVIEVANEGGERMGMQRLEAMLATISQDADTVETLLAHLARHRGLSRQQDDITLLEVRALAPGQQADVAATAVPAREALDWSVSFEFDATALRRLDAMPPLVQLLVEFQGLNEHRERLFMVLAELFNNALEHGLLGIDSSVKATPGGFATYYEQRLLALENLSEGWIRIQLKHAAMADGGELVIRLEHSGRGFDYPAWLAREAGQSEKSGRGIALVQRLCADFRYEGDGNIVEARYVWRRRA